MSAVAQQPVSIAIEADEKDFQVITHSIYSKHDIWLSTISFSSETNIFTAHHESSDIPSLRQNN